MPVRLPWLVALSVVAACGPERAPKPKGDEAQRYADAYCEALEACGCQPRHGDGPECRNEMEARFTSMLDDDYILDLDCFEDVVERGDLDDCSPVDTLPGDEWGCRVLRGKRQHHEPCAPRGYGIPPFEVDECDEGLRCVDAMCVRYDEIPTLRVEGDPCIKEEPASCFGNMLYCTPEGTCATAPHEGEACTSLLACVYAHDVLPIYCAGLDASQPGICTEPHPAGAPCNPADTFACVGDGSAYGWCNPATSTCAGRSSAVCAADDYSASRATR